MTDKATIDWLRNNVHMTGHAASLKKDGEGEEAQVPAFGYLRGIRDRAITLEIRSKDGNTRWFPYSLMGACQFNPSEGILLKFSGDLIYLVLIRGSNLDAPINDGQMNLTAAGLQRHRVVWIREMPEEDIKLVGDKGPTIDSIVVEEFESHADFREWLGRHAPAFVK